MARKRRYVVLVAIVVTLLLLLLAARYFYLGGNFLSGRNSEADITLELGNGVIMEFASIPAGFVRMGAPDHENFGDPQFAPRWEYREHNVYSFHMALYETTNEQFLCFLNSGYASKGNWSQEGQEWMTGNGKLSAHLQRISKLDGRLPVAGINHYEAEAFCNWLSGLSSKQYGLSARLPTEIEWEYCAEGETQEGESRLCVWGDANGNREIDETDAGWTNTDWNLGRDNVEGLARGGQFQHDLSWCGLYDMNGNVAEIVISSPGNPRLTPLNPNWGLDPMITKGHRVFNTGNKDSIQRQLENLWEAMKIGLIISD